MPSPPEDTVDMPRLRRSWLLWIGVEIVAIVVYVALMRRGSRPVYPPTLTWAIVLLAIPFGLLRSAGWALLKKYDEYDDRKRAQGPRSLE